MPIDSCQNVSPGTRARRVGDLLHDDAVQLFAIDRLLVGVFSSSLIYAALRWCGYF